MSDNWQSIRTLSIGDIGDTVDIQDDGRHFYGMEIYGIEVQHDVVQERYMGGSTEYRIGPVSTFVVNTAGSTIALSYNASWRRSVR